MAKSIIREKSFAFAVNCARTMMVIMDTKKHYIFTKQVMRSSSSIGANVEEGGQAESLKDFIHKHSISLKEAHETDYWLRLMMETQLLDEEKGKELRKQCSEVCRILAEIIKSSKERLNNPNGN